MNLDQILCEPLDWFEKISKISVPEDATEVLPFLNGKVVEIFCRGGEWGRYLQSSGIDWYGLDPNPRLLESAFLRGVFSVTVGTLPSANSCDVIFGPMAPFSMVHVSECNDFVSGLYEGLRSKGKVLLALWEPTKIKSKKPLLFTFNGEPKLSMACTAHYGDGLVSLEMEWMVASRERTPFYQIVQEKRFLHREIDLTSIFESLFQKVEIQILSGRRWLLAEKF